MICASVTAVYSLGGGGASIRLVCGGGGAKTSVDSVGLCLVQKCCLVMIVKCIDSVD